MTPADLQLPERGSAPVDDPAITAAKEEEAAKAAWLALPADTLTDEETPKYKAAVKRLTKAENAFAAAPITSIAGATIKLRALGKDLADDGTAAYATGHVKTVLAFLEGFTGVPSVIGDDPAVVAFAELKAAWAAFDGLGEEEPGHGVHGDPRHAAAYKRYAEARDAVRDAVPVSLAGVAAKVGALLEPYRADPDVGGFDQDYDRSAKAMLPFLEGAPGPAPKPDPVVTLFAEWQVLQDEVMALSKTDPEEADHNVGDQQDNLYDRQNTIERQIIETAAPSVGGIAVKLRLMTYMKFPMKGLPDLHRTPAKDTDFEGMIEAWRYDGDLFWDDELLIGSLRDAERLAGVS